MVKMAGVKAYKHVVSTRHHKTIVCLFLVIATCAVYWQVVTHEFINLDDKLYVVENRFVSSGISLENVIWAFRSFHASNWHPLTWLSHMIDSEIFGLNPGMHHLVNVLLHLANSLLVFLVLYEMAGKLWRSAFVAFLFALHPLHVESVAWIAERKDVLSTLFWMLTIWCYCRYVKYSGTWRYVCALILFVMGLMAKPMVVTLPFVLLLLDFWPLQRLRLGNQESLPVEGANKKSTSFLILEKVPFFILVLASSAVTLLAQKSGGAVASTVALTLGERTANAVVSYVTYLYKIIWPVNLAVFYPYPEVIPWWHVTAATVLLLVVTGGVVIQYKRRPYLPVGWLWYLGTLVPVIGIVQVGAQAMADRYTYVPIIGVFIMISWGANDLVRSLRMKKIVLSVSAGIILMFFMASTLFQIEYWHDDINLSAHAIKVTNRNYLAHNNLGLALEQEGRIIDAVGHYSRALEINPRYVDAHVNIGVALSALGRFDEAVGHYKDAIRLRPGLLEAHYNLGGLFLRRGEVDEAIEHFDESLRINPGIAQAHNGLGIALVRKGDMEGAIWHFREALRLDPANEGARENLDRAEEMRSRFEEEAGELKGALEADPNNAGIYVKLGDMYRSRGGTGEAIEYYRGALEVDEGYLPALSRLAVVYGVRGEEEKALEVLKKVVELRPDSAGAYYNIACIYSRQGDVDESVLWLKGAVERGFDDWELLKTDKDLDNIRGSEYCRELMEGR
jgi:tetratricopeptide (TPR) repeat protein